MTSRSRAASAGDRRPARRRRRRARLHGRPAGRASRAASSRNGRFFYWAYWRDLEPARTALADVAPRARLRLHLPQRGRPHASSSSRPTTTGCRSSAPTVEGAYMRDARARCPTRPTSRAPRQESKLLGKLDLPNVLAARRRARPRVRRRRRAGRRPALGRRLRLGASRAPSGWSRRRPRAALGGDLDAALERYRQVTCSRLAPHHFDDRRHRQRPAGQPRSSSCCTARPRATRAWPARSRQVGTRRRSPAPHARPARACPRGSLSPA